jgi:protoporphyrin/coproporphyrin ferrochelatase
MKKGILVINLGTPNSPDVKSVKKYLAEFLMDPFVIDIPYPLRLLLVRGIILNTRPKHSAHAYQQIWTKQGSPLLVNTLELTQKLASKLQQNYCVSLGMRYGNPAIKTAAKELLKCKTVLILPIFPQYSLAATESAIQKAVKELKHLNFKGDINIINDFYEHPTFIQAQTELIKQHKTPGSHLLFSYHGLPIKHLDKVSNCKEQCDRLHACPNITKINKQCYRAQCYTTTQKIAQTSQLKINEYSVSFQSRLGKLPWIQPYTTEWLVQLREKGISKLDIICPSFFVDCLENLEEINIQAREQWIGLGGDSFNMIPCLNSSIQAVETLAEIIKSEETQ